jgi:phage terminase small subunit
LGGGRSGSDATKETVGGVAFSQKPPPLKRKSLMAQNRPKAPAHLRTATARWWRSVLDDFALEDHHVRLLTLAATAWDRAEQAREAIDALGPTFSDRFGQPKSRPEIAVERDSMVTFCRVLRELDLDVDPPAERSRPPALRSNRRGV